MNLVKTPLRISYVGGGTDFPSFYTRNEGCGVIASAINQFVYIYSHQLSPIAKEQIRFTYRETESVNLISDLKHPVMREMLRFCNWEKQTNFGTFSDLPSGVGLGGSSSFAVGLAHLITHSNSDQVTPQVLADLAVHVERIVLMEAGGVQDQYVAAFGGFRKYNFTSEKVEVSEHIKNSEFMSYLEKRQMLIWLEETRFSERHAAVTEAEINNSNSYLKETVDLFQDTSKIFSNEYSASKVFEILRDAVKIGWSYKKKFTGELNESAKMVEIVLSKFPDIGYKLCGAGGSGFMLVLAEPDVLENIKNSLVGYSFVNPRISINGSILQQLT
jgi:D-glycero-alpha-D-manno-heptose-7-phosphate kinase